MPRAVIAIGGSAGAIEPLRRLVAALPGDLTATVLVTVHIPADAHSALPHILGRRAALRVAHAVDGAPLEPGTVLVAPPDHHLLVENDHVRLSHGPRENGHRPAIDPMFRTAARSRGPRAIGVVLSGALDDGTAGLRAIDLRGGAALVQDPAEAEYPSMPESARAHVGAARAMRLDEMAEALVSLALDDPPETAMTEDPVDPGAPELESTDTAPEKDAMDDRAGVPSGLTCPDCHGALWEVVDGELVRYRCRVGHAFAPASLLAYQDEGIEEALWAAYRALEESASMSTRLAEKMHRQGLHASARKYEEKRDAALARARTVFRALEAEAGHEAHHARRPRR